MFLVHVEVIPPVACRARNFLSFERGAMHDNRCRIGEVSHALSDKVLRHAFSAAIYVNRPESDRPKSASLSLALTLRALFRTSGVRLTAVLSTPAQKRQQSPRTRLRDEQRAKYQEAAQAP